MLSKHIYIYIKKNLVFTVLQHKSHTVSKCDSASKYFQTMCHNSSVHFYCVLVMGLEVIKMLNSIPKGYF